MLIRIVTNLALNLLRDTKRRAELLRANTEDPDDLRPGGLALDELLLLRQVLASVPEREAHIASYYYLDGMDQDEIAALLGMQRRTVGRLLDKFRYRSARLLQKTREAEIP